MLKSITTHNRTKLANTIFSLIQISSLVGTLYGVRGINTAKNKSKTEGAALLFVINASILIFLSAFSIKENKRIREKEVSKKPTSELYVKTLHILNRKLANQDEENLEKRAEVVYERSLNLPKILEHIINHKEKKSIKLPELELSPRQQESYPTTLDLFMKIEESAKQEDIPIEKFDLLIYEIVEKQWRHGAIFNGGWFGAGNFGWALSNLLASNLNWFLRQFYSGLGTTGFLFAAMWISQTILSFDYFGGRPLNESWLLQVQFLVDVTSSDGLWQGATDLPRLMLTWLGFTNKTNLEILSIFYQISAFYLAEAFLFMILHNFSNMPASYINKKYLKSSQLIWPCSISFTTLLWQNYCSFNYIAKQLSDAMKARDNLFLSALACGLGGMVLPMIVYYAQYLECMNEIKTVFSKKDTPYLKSDVEANFTIVHNPIADAPLIRQELIQPTKNTDVATKKNENTNAEEISSWIKHGFIFIAKTLPESYVQIAADIITPPFKASTTSFL